MIYKPLITNQKIIFNLKKPIYNSFYTIWEKWLTIADKRKLKIIIKTPEGIAIFKNVKEYLKGAKKIERFYKNPNEPMIFYGRDLLSDIQKQKEKLKQLEREALTDQPILDFEAKLNLLKIYQKVFKKNNM